MLFWARYVAQIGEERNPCTVLEEKLHTWKKEEV
jgi:hypothetical protein